MTAAIEDVDSQIDRYHVEFDSEYQTFNVVRTDGREFRLPFRNAANAEKYAVYLNDPAGPKPDPLDLYEPSSSRRQTGNSVPISRSISAMLWVARVLAGLLTGTIGIISVIEMIKLAVEIIQGSHALAFFLFFFCGIGVFMLLIPPAIAFWGFASLYQHEDKARPGRTCWRYVYGSVGISIAALLAGWIVALILEGLLWVVTR